MPSPRKKIGIVHLVGAGPGDPGLITVRGMHLLESADVVVFDYLANPRLLRHCPKAETIYVGKQAASHAMSQADINQLLVNLAQSGKRVVRLKGGDPFVFGRGGEECEALAAANIPFEVVPGITAAIAAPAYAGIPITHRDFNSSFTLLTGHEKETDYQEPDAQKRSAGKATDLDFAALAKLPCLAFYMGVKSLPGICAKLIENGMSPDMPAATIQWGTTPRQRTIVATLADLPQKVAEAKLSPPAITIIGRVVEMRKTISWFDHRPLFGQTIVVTRTRQQASDLSARLEELGARVLEAPTIELAPPADLAPIDAALRSIASYDWVIFTSRNGVACALERMRQLGLDARAFANTKIAAVGQSTADAISQLLFLKTDLSPKSFIAEALAAALKNENAIAGKRFLLLRADIARPILREKLKEGGAAEVADIAIYESRPAGSLPPALLEAIKEKHIHWITFTSSSTAKNLVKLLGPDYRKMLEGVKIASIGPITTATLNELQLPPIAVSESSSIEALVEAIKGEK